MARRRFVNLPAALALSAGLAVLPMGCLEEDALAAAIQQASADLQGLAAPGSAVPGDDLRERTYTEAIAALRPHLSDGSPAQQAAAWLLIGQAELGLAAEPLDAAADARREAIQGVNAIRSRLESHSRTVALAAAAESFDPGPEIEALRASIAERAESIRAVEAEDEALRARIAEFESRAAEAREAETGFRNAEAELRERALSLSAQDGLPLIREASVQRGRADELAAQADRSLAEADALRPGVSAFEGEIDRLSQQRTLLESSIASLETQARDTAGEASRYRAEAEAIAMDIVEAAASADAYRTGVLEPAAAAAESALETAATSAGRAAAGNRAGSKLLSAEIDHAHGGLALAQAATLDTLAEAMAEAARRTGQADAGIADTIEQVRASAAAARERGTEALRSARDGYESASVRGEAGERIGSAIDEITRTLGEPVESDEASDDGTP
ncbi:MAG: hypothetical protein AAFR96_05150 [Planctomycetota bacterium]